MSIISQPNVTVNKLPASLAQGIEAQKILVVNQKLPTGSATAGALIESISKSQVNSLFGAGSFMANSLNAIFDVFERSGSLTLPRVDAIPLDDAAGTNATSAIVIAEVGGATNQATVAGTIEIIVASQFNYTVSLDITVDQAIVSGAGNIGDAIADAINLLTDLPVTAANVAGTITLTCRHDGTIGNGIAVKAVGFSLSGSDQVLGNVGIVLNPFASGATDPTVTNVLDAVGDERYQTTIHPVEYGTAFSVDNFLDNRFNVDNNILDGVAIVKDTDTLSNLKTSLTSLNSQSLVYLSDKLITEDLHEGPALVELDFVVSSRVGALRALRLTDNANITKVTPAAANGPLDAVGGAHIASLPYFNTPLDAVSPIQTGKGFTQVEVEELIAVGGAVIGNNTSGNKVILGEIVTTYLTDVSANPDATWHFLNTVDTMSVSAEIIFNNLKADFAQSRLTEGDLVSGFAMVNSEAFRAQMKKYYLDLADLALTPAGQTPVDFFLENLVIVIDVLNGKITTSGNLPIVVQLREILVNLKTTFSIV